MVKSFAASSARLEPLGQDQPDAAKGNHPRQPIQIQTGRVPLGTRPKHRRRSVDRGKKEALVAELRQTFDENELVVVTHQSGLTVAEASDLRRKMREAGARFKVTKNRLAKLALKETKFEHLTDDFSGPTAIAVSVDPVAAAKVAVEFANKNDKLQIVSGALGEKGLDADGVKALAKLPSLDELRGMIVGLLQAPAGKLASVTQAPASQLARVFGAYAAKD
jgi:large subunit ribosomal protein L10